MNLLILFIVLVVSLQRLPYLSSAQRVLVLEEHRKLAYTDPEHAKMEAEIQMLVKRNHLSGRSKTGTTLDRLLRRRDGASDPLVLQAFDYNTVDSTLLSVCVLINLFAVMLASERFVGSKMDANRGEYTAITFVEMLLIIGGLLYYAIAFGFDLMLALCPNSARAVAGGFGRAGPLSGGGSGGSGGLVAGGRQNLTGAERRALVAARKNIHSLSSVASDPGDGLSGDAGGGMSVNPFMAARLRKAGSVRLDGDDDHDDMAATVSAVMALELPPDTEQWMAVKTVFASLQDNVAQLQGLLKAQNRDAARSLDARERSRGSVARSARLSPLLEDGGGTDAGSGSGGASGGVGRGAPPGSAVAAFAASAATQALKARVGGRKLKPIGLTDGSALLGGGHAATGGVRSTFTPVGAASAASAKAAAGGAIASLKAARGAGTAAASGSAAAEAIAAATMSLQCDSPAAWAASNPLWTSVGGSHGRGGADSKAGETRRVSAMVAPATGGMGIGRVAARIQRPAGPASASVAAAAGSTAAAPAAAASSGARVRVPRPTTEPSEEACAVGDERSEEDAVDEDEGQDVQGDGADGRGVLRVAVVRVRPDGSRG
jgi:hypothetical protein